MNIRILPIIALLAFAAAPIVMGSAEQAKKTGETKSRGKDEDENESLTERKVSSECIASEEVIADLETRESKMKQREEKLKEKEQEIAAAQKAVKAELDKLDGKRAEIQTAKQKDIAAREEQVNKLVETFEGMSPKAAASVLAGVDEDLAVTTLGRLTSSKAGKILSNLKPEKSSRLSELMAYGKVKDGKEAAHGESENRVPASQR